MNEGVEDVAGSGLTLLVGKTESIVFVTVFVLMDAFASKTIVAWLLMVVPFARLDFGFTLKVTYPVPWLLALLGGRKPATGLAGRPPVVGSTDSIVQFRMPVLGFSEALMLTGFGSVETLTRPT